MSPPNPRRGGGVAPLSPLPADRWLLPADAAELTAEEWREILAAAASLIERAAGAFPREEAERRGVLVARWRAARGRRRLVAMAWRCRVGDPAAVELTAAAALRALDLLLDGSEPYVIPDSPRADRAVRAYLYRQIRGWADRKGEKGGAVPLGPQVADAAASAETPVEHDSTALLVAMLIAMGRMPALQARFGLGWILTLLSHRLFGTRGVGATPKDSNNKRELQGHVRVWARVCEAVPSRVEAAISRRADPAWIAFWSSDETPVTVIGALPADLMADAMRCARAWADGDVGVPCAVVAGGTDATLWERKGLGWYFKDRVSFKTLGRNLGERVALPTNLGRERGAAAWLLEQLPRFCHALARHHGETGHG